MSAVLFTFMLACFLSNFSSKKFNQPTFFSFLSMVQTINAALGVDHSDFKSEKREVGE